MQIPRQIEPDSTGPLKQLLHVYGLSVGIMGNGMDWKSRFMRGLFTEKFIIENLLCRTYPPELLKWNAESLDRQLYGKPDGVPDPGWDVEADGMRIDIKWDAGMQSDSIHLGLFTKYGTPLLLTKGTANVSSQVYLQYRQLSAVEQLMNTKLIALGKRPKPELTLKVLWIDLDAVRADLTETENAYSIGGYPERTVYKNGEPTDRIITVPVKFLLNKYARLDTIEC